MKNLIISRIFFFRINSRTVDPSSQWRRSRSYFTSHTVGVRGRGTSETRIFMGTERGFHRSRNETRFKGKLSIRSGRVSTI